MGGTAYACHRRGDGRRRAVQKVLRLRVSTTLRSLLITDMTDPLHVPVASPLATQLRRRTAGADATFQLEEATIASVHAAFERGSLTCEGLVRQYLERIDAYDRQGPALQAIITINPNALAMARRMDADRANGRAAGKPLHGVPIILKDNFHTVDMPTSGGNVAMRHSRTASDAFTVARMRAAGALILAKANLHELARGGVSVSSLGGQVRNPYDLGRNPGGSSGGTGAAIAANFGLVGTGSDTGQSIRSPASANSLVGIRPTRGLVSRHGVMPNSFTQDEIGPIARTVTDAARLLDVMVGFDPDDPVTAFGVGRVPDSYVQALRPDALEGARLGVMAQLMGSQARHQEVNRVMEALICRMEVQGATVVRFSLPEYDELAKVVATDSFEAVPALERYFAELPDDAPIRSFAQLVETRSATGDVQKTLQRELAIANANGMQSTDYKDRMLNRDRMRVLLAATMAQHKLDALLYPMQRMLVTKAGEALQPERNGTLAHGTGFPAVTFPAGFSTPTDSAPLGVPVGAELLGLDYAEPQLLAYAYAYEQAYPVRKPPLSTPALAGH